MVGRVCLDMLRARRARREDYVGTWLPEPIVSLDDAPNPEHEALLADSVGLALLVVLETLTPAERLAFVLHDMFGVPFDEIAPIVGRTPDAARQLASRARRRVRGRRCPDPDLAQQRESSTPSSPPPAPVTSTRSSRCSTPTSSSAPTRAPAARWPGPDRGRRACRPQVLAAAAARPLARPAIVNGAAGAGRGARAQPSP